MVTGSFPRLLEPLHLFCSLYQLLYSPDDMLSKYTAPNSFGGESWAIKLHSLLRIVLNETNQGSFIVELKERKWIKEHTHFSFVCSTNLTDAITESFERTFDVFLEHPDFAWSREQKEGLLKRALSELENTTQALS